MYYNISIQDDTLCEISKRKIIADGDDTFLLINCDKAVSCSEELIRTKCCGKEIEIEVNSPEVNAIAHWFEINRRPQRKFNWNPKHGENGKGANFSNKGDKVSILMCSRGEAGLLLKKAIGTGTASKTLYFYDSKCNQYIEFKKESENTYHAFHLDDEDQRRITETVKNSIKRLL